jgi:aldehyde dehydrogenase (NAD+)
MACITGAAKEIGEAQAKDGVRPSDFTGAAGMITGAAYYYMGKLDEWAAPKNIGDTLSPERNNGIECDWVRIKEPKGVVLNIAPWNAPAVLDIVPVLGALAAGNCCIIKPSEVTSATSALIADLIAAKMDPSAVTVVQGGSEVVEGLIDLGFDHIMFTGGPSIGKLIMARAAKTLTPVTLELGGKNPVCIDEMNDEHLSAAVAEIVGTKAAFAGQFCQCHDIIFVVDSMWERFTESLGASVQGLGERRMVRLIHAKQFARVKDMLDNHSGTALPAIASDVDPKSLCLPVTAILEPGANDSVMQDEVFGPLWCVLRVGSITEAIERARTLPTGKPLVSYYYGSSEQNAELWRAQTSSGSLAVNCGPMRMQSNFEAAIHGVGNSGMGGASLWGEHVFNTFSHTKHSVRPKGGAFAGSIWSGPGATYKP